MLMEEDKCTQRCDPRAPSPTRNEVHSYTVGAHMMVVILAEISSSAEIKSTYRGIGNLTCRNGGDGAHDMVRGV